MEARLPDPGLSNLLKGWGINAALLEESAVDAEETSGDKEIISSDYDEIPSPPPSSSSLPSPDEKEIESSIGEWLESQAGTMGLNAEGSEGDVVELSDENEGKSEEEILEEFMLCESVGRGPSSSLPVEEGGDVEREEVELTEGFVIR